MSLGKKAGKAKPVRKCSTCKYYRNTVSCRSAKPYDEWAKDGYCCG